MSVLKAKTKPKYPLGQYLKTLRKQKDVSLMKVEKSTGVSNAYISQLETGARRRLPTPERLRALGDYYNVSVKELLERAGYYEAKDIEETYEQKIEKAFLHAVSDPKFNCGSKINPKELSTDAKRFVIELYGHVQRIPKGYLDNTRPGSAKKCFLTRS